MTESLLEISALTKAFDDRKVLDSMGLAVAAGERLSIQGPSGTGKTTLLRIIAGLDSADSGCVTIAGKLATDGQSIKMPPWKRGVQLVFQDLGLWPTRTVLQNVTDARKAAGLGEVKQASLDALEALGLADHLSRKPGTLSGGEARRLAFARALAMEPKLLLLDEPFASLDPEARQAGFDLLECVLERTSAAVILVTHDDHEAALLGGTSNRLHQGVLQCV